MRSVGLVVVALAAFVSTSPAATVTELPMLPTPTAPYPPAYSAAPRPVQINAAGDIVGWTSFTRRPCSSCPVQSVRRSFLISNGSATQIGIDEFIATAINDAGQIVGNWRDLWGTGMTYAYRIEAGEMVLLDSSPRTVTDINNFDEVSFGPEINDHGVLAAMASDNEHANHAFKWAAGTPMIDLDCVAPTPEYECITGGDTGFDHVHDLNNGATVADAMAVGEDRDNPWYSSYGQQHAYVGWQGSTAYLSSGFTAAALAVNNHGLIVGYDDGQAVIWEPTGTGAWTERTIASLVSDPGWTFAQATSVNDDGVVVGWGTHNGVPAIFSVSSGTLAVQPPASDAAQARFAAYPNPTRGALRFRGSLPSTASTARITVVDVAGRGVTDLQVALVNGAFEASWDGRSTSGGALKAGVYFARVSAGSATARTTLLLLR